MMLLEGLITMVSERTRIEALFGLPEKTALATPNPQAYPRLQDVGYPTATRIGFYIDKIRKNI